MWLVFATLSLLAFAATDILGKRKIDAGTPLTAVELLASSAVLAFAAGLALYAGGFGESGRAPWSILADEPLILATSLCFALYTLLGLVAFRYLGLSVDASLAGTNGIVFFIGLMIVHLLTGQLGAVRTLFHPARLIPILVVLSGVFLLPRLERTPAARRRTVVGMMMLLLALMLDGGDSLITAVVFDAGRIGPVDFMIAGWFAMLPLVALLLVMLRMTGGRWPLPFRGGASTVGYAALACAASTTYLVASSHDAVRTGLVFIAEPVFTLVAARLFLGEHYAPRQTICLWAIALAAIAFCILDGVL